MTLTKITLAFVVIGIALTVTIAPLIVNQAFAAISTVITGQQCENPAGNQPGGQQPTCTGSGLTQVTETPGPPDDDCLFDPSLPKCVPIDGKCPDGFLMNENEQCFPDKPCPPGFEKRDQDDTGRCYTGTVGSSSRDSNDNEE